MISCVDFIPAYSELFKFIENKSGEMAVVEFWEYLSDDFLGNLRDYVCENGIRGCWMYWSRALNEEAAGFTMELDEENEEFKIIMHHCPSKGRLLTLPQINPYHSYCRHCDVLYKRALEPFGFDCRLDMSQCGEAKCSLHIKSAYGTENHPRNKLKLARNSLIN